MGGVGRLACQGFLVREACVGVLVHGTGFFSLWSAMECPEVSLRWVYVFGVTLGSLYADAQGYVPALLENLCGMSCSATYWLFSIHSEGHPERFTQLHEEEEREEGDRGEQEEKWGHSRGERQI